MDNKEIINLADMLKGEINRMCVTHDFDELENMNIYAMDNLEKLWFANYDRILGESEE